MTTEHSRSRTTIDLLVCDVSRKYAIIKDVKVEHGGNLDDFHYLNYPMVFRFLPYRIKILNTGEVRKDMLGSEEPWPDPKDVPTAKPHELERDGGVTNRIVGYTADNGFAMWHPAVRTPQERSTTRA